MNLALVNALAAMFALTTVQAQDRPATVPFAVGERLSYDVKFGPLKAGRGTMEVMEVVDVRGRPAWRVALRVKGGITFFKVNNVLESWIDTTTFSSLRFVQDFDQTGSDRQKTYEIFPERQEYQDGEKAPVPSVEFPLDDAAFIYFARTLPLEIGVTYSFDRYFKPDRNPVRIKVLRRERIKVPAGTFQTIVVQPIIKAKGIFSENGKAEIWFTEDERRLMVQMKTNLSIGSLSLYLKSIRLPDSAAATPPPSPP